MKQLNLAQTAKRTLLSLVVASLLLQGLFPSGYMPGNLASGWVAVLCPEGLPAAFVQQLNERVESNGGHAHHHHHGHHNELAGEHLNPASAMDAAEGSCQLGSALDQPGVIGQVQTVSAALDVALDVPLPPVLQATGSVFLTPLSRGPPVA